MSSSVSLLEVLGLTVPIIISVLLFWKNTDVRLKALEIRVEANEKNEERVMSKLEDLQKSMNDIKIALQDKQDRN
jgi:C4-dicarboxylate-specific signal transduction histidine kinase